MSDLRDIEDRLNEIGCNFRVWGRSELKELANVLMQNEIIEHCVNGSYTGGFAMLVATDKRVLLIDKKPMYLTLEDTRYDMITEVDYNHHLLDANIYVRTPSKSLRFVAYNQARLRKLFNFVQHRVAVIREQFQQAATQQQELMQRQLEGMQFPQQQVYQPLVMQQGFGQLPTGQVQQLLPQQGMYANQFLNRTVAPIISAYTRLPMMSRQRRFLGSRAVSGRLSIYNGQQQQI